jgi:hypothetical protein
MNIDTISQTLTRFSKRFDKKSNYIGKSWVLVDENRRPLMELEFFKDDRLLSIISGNAMWGKWEVSPNTNRLILEYGDHVEVCEVAFLDSAVMLTQKSDFRPINIFINKTELPSFQYEYYLSQLADRNKKVSASTSSRIFNQPRSNPEQKRTQNVTPTVSRMDRDTKISLYVMAGVFIVGYLIASFDKIFG